MTDDHALSSAKTLLGWFSGIPRSLMLPLSDIHPLTPALLLGRKSPLFLVVFGIEPNDSTAKSHCSGPYTYGWS